MSAPAFITVTLLSFWRLKHVQAFSITHHRNRPVACWSSNLDFSSAEPDVTSKLDSTDPFTAALSTETMDRSAAEGVIETVLYPASELTVRVRAGGEAQGIGRAEVVKADDPRNALTYGEFPLHSFDELVDRALEVLPARSTKRIKMVDLGSGCARLVLYAALSRGSSVSDDKPGFDVHGIEISNILHDIGVSMLKRGLDQGYFRPLSKKNGEEASVVQLHVGSAESLQYVLADADVIFAYSTVWPAEFSEELGAMVLGGEWSQMLSNACKSGCAVVMTDRALDPKYGWELVEQINVDNPCLSGSAGYVHVLKK